MASTTPAPSTAPPQSLYASPYEWVQAYWDSLERPSPGTVKITAGYSLHIQGDLYLSPTALKKASNLFKANIPDDLDKVSAPMVTFTFNDVGFPALEVFALWLYVHDRATDWDRTAFNLAAANLMTRSYILGNCWQLAVKFESLPFRNWLMTSVGNLPYSDWRRDMWYIAQLFYLNLAGSPLLRRLLEDMAFAVAQDRLKFEYIVAPWMENEILVKAGPVLLGELLIAIGDMKALRAAQKLTNPTKLVCWKWHKHQSLEERKACPDYTEDQLELDVSDDEEGVRVDTAKRQDVGDPVDGMGWMQALRKTT